MPHTVTPLQIRLLPAELRKSTRLGAEVVLPESMNLFDAKSLSDAEKETFRKGFFDNGVLLIRNQTGIDPQVLYDIADVLDPDHLPYHSGGQKQVTDSKNILSQNNCSRIPRAPQVTVIGSGHVENYEGIGELDLKHLDQSSFHEHPLSGQEVADGRTRPYRWHMDAALYENLPGYVTSLHAIEVPEVPKQRLQFSEDETMDVPAGATLCECMSSLTTHSVADPASLLRRTKFCSSVPGRTRVCDKYYCSLRASSVRDDPQLQGLIRRSHHRGTWSRNPDLGSATLHPREGPLFSNGLEKSFQRRTTLTDRWMLRLLTHYQRPRHRQ